jgi:hypothetical protein
MQLIIITFVVFQRYYFHVKLRRMRMRRRDGVDPIKTAFERMKVNTWQSIIFCF